MKRPGLLAGFVAATLFLAAAFGAQVPDPDTLVRWESTPKMAPRGEKSTRLQSYKKGAGRPDAGEKAAAPEAMSETASQRPPKAPDRKTAADDPLLVREPMLRRFDLNADGQFDDAERATAITRVAENINRFPALKQRLDRNANGKLDADERAAFVERMRSPAATAKRPGPANTRAPGNARARLSETVSPSDEALLDLQQPAKK